MSGDNRRNVTYLRSPSTRLTFRLVVVAAVTLVAAACGNAGSPTASDESGELTVFAAASLTEAFSELADDFEDEYPEVDVTLNFAGSSGLARQLNEGAPAGVFASANEDQMQRVAAHGNISGKSTDFVQNKLQIAVPDGNPAGVHDLQSLSDSDVTLAVCADDVPCGSLTQDVFDRAGVDAEPDTLEKDVKAVLTKVRLGEADAGLVYATDVATSDEVTGIDVPEADAAVNDYPIAVTDNAPDPEAAQAFVDYVQSDDAQSVLRRYGFITGGS